MFEKRVCYWLLAFEVIDFFPIYIRIFIEMALLELKRKTDDGAER